MKKSVIMTIAVVCVLLAGIIGVGALNSEPARRTSVDKEEPREDVEEESIKEEAVAVPEVEQTKEPETQVPEEEKEPEVSETKEEPVETEKEPIEKEDKEVPDKEETQAEESDGKNTETTSPETIEKKEPQQDIDDVVNQLEKQEAEEEKNITFPYAIPGTEMVIQKIEPFDGIYLEDGTDEAVSNVTTMLLENKGYTDVEYAEISIKCDGKKLMFEVSVLPGGSSMIVQEKNKAQYKKGTYQECRAEAAETGRLEMSERLVKVTEKGGNSLEITNLSNETIPMVRIFYKYYMKEENVYVGGITYTAKIDDLEKGSTQVVTPKHYLDGDSRVVMVRTYEN